MHRSAEARKAILWRYQETAVRGAIFARIPCGMPRSPESDRNNLPASSLQRYFGFDEMHARPFGEFEGSEADRRPARRFPSVSSIAARESGFVLRIGPPSVSFEAERRQKWSGLHFTLIIKELSDTSGATVCVISSWSELQLNLYTEDAFLL